MPAQTPEEVRRGARVLSAKDFPGTIRSFFPYWDAQIRPFLLDAVLAIPADRFDFRPRPEMFTARETIVHIAECEIGWVGAIMEGRAQDWPQWFVALDPKEPSKGWRITPDVPDHAALLALLEKCHRPTQAWLDRPVADLDTVIRYQIGSDPERVNSAQWILSRVQEHEIHHRMQLVMYLRLMGLEPPLTM